MGPAPGIPFTFLSHFCTLPTPLASVLARGVLTLTLLHIVPQGEFTDAELDGFTETKSGISFK